MRKAPIERPQHPVRRPFDGWLVIVRGLVVLVAGVAVASLAQVI